MLGVAGYTRSKVGNMGIRVNIVTRGYLMNRLTRRILSHSRSHPSQFLQRLEWIMLAVCGSMAIVDALENHQSPIQHILILGLLGGMGFVIPIGTLQIKVLYTLIELILIFYGTLLGYLHVLPVLYLIVVIRSCFLFEISGRWITALISLLCFLFHQIQYSLSATPDLSPRELQAFWMYQLAETLMFGLGLALVLRLASALLSERQIKDELLATHAELTDAHLQLQAYASQVEQMTILQERNLIAQEIHDSLGHALTALNIQLKVAKNLWNIDPSKSAAAVDAAQELGKMAILEVRESVQTLRARLPEPPLSQAIVTLVENFQHNTGIQVNLQQETLAIVPQPINKTVYRVLQEALTNVVKHAGATVVEVAVSSAEGQLRLSVQDNGRGFDVERTAAGMGLNGMGDRLQRLGGRLQLRSSQGAGCEVTVELPLHEVCHDSSVDRG
jgi:signal transduction histidine kinase